MVRIVNTRLFLLGLASLTSSLCWRCEASKQCRFKSNADLSARLLNQPEDNTFSWISPDALCDYRCSSGASQSFQSFCQESCECTQSEKEVLSSHRHLAQVSICEDLSVRVDPDSKSPFGDFTSYIISQRSKLLEGGAAKCDGPSNAVNITKTSTVDASSTGRIALRGEDDTGKAVEYPTPYLVRLSPSQSRDVISKLHNAVPDGQVDFRPVIGTSYMYETSLKPSQVSLIRQTLGVELVIPLPPVQKLHNSLLLSLQKATAESIPSLEVYLDPSSGVSTALFIQSANSHFEKELGISNLISETDHRGRIVVPALSNTVYFAKAIEHISSTSVVTGIQLKSDWSLFTLLRDSHKSVLSSSLSPRKRRLDVEASKLLGADVAHKNGIDGSGVVATCSDSGVYMYHDQFIQASIPYNKVDKTQRKVIYYMQQNGNGFDSSARENDTCGHGTHVCGILAGSSAKGLTNLGTAPGAKLVVGDIGGNKTKGSDAISIVPPAIPAVFGPVDVTGSKIFSFSWGSSGQGNYDNEALSYDKYLSDNPDVLVFLAVGNSGNGKADDSTPNCSGGQIASPAMAKNVISVGASVNTFPEGSCGAYQTSAVAHFSSWGPAPGGARKPEILCPGFQMTSAMSLPQASFEQKIETSETCALSGTSQACPACAGVGVLVYQWLKEGRWKSGAVDPGAAIAKPTAALVKALLVYSGQALKTVLPNPVLLGDNPSCDQLTKQAGTTVYGDYIQGFGRVSLTSILKLGTSDIPSFVMLPTSNPTSESVKQGEEKVYTYVSNKGARTFRAVLAWNDLPPSQADVGDVCKTMLVNDLDLIVTASFSDGTKAIVLPVDTKGGTGVDRINNLEVVQIPASNKGKVTYTISVKGFNVRSGSQPFAIVAAEIDKVVVNDLANVWDGTEVKKDSTEWVIIIIIGSILLTFAVFGILFCLWWRKRKLQRLLKEGNQNNGFNRHDSLDEGKLGEQRGSRASRSSGVTTLRSSHASNSRVSGSQQRQSHQTQHQIASVPMRDSRVRSSSPAKSSIPSRENSVFHTPIGSYAHDTLASAEGIPLASGQIYIARPTPVPVSSTASLGLVLPPVLGLHVEPPPPVPGNDDSTSESSYASADGGLDSHGVRNVEELMDSAQRYLRAQSNASEPSFMTHDVRESRVQL